MVIMELLKVGEGRACVGAAKIISCTLRTYFQVVEDC